LNKFNILENNKILLVAGAALAYWFYTKKQAIGLLNYYIANVGLSFDGFTPILRLNIGIQNPSNASFVIKDFVGNLVANGNNIGTMSSFVPLDVPAASQVVYPIYVRLNLIGIVSDIVNLIQNKSGIAQDIELTGFVNASGVVAPIDLKYKLAF
jgi:LEA14-like dessication related protein